MRGRVWSPADGPGPTEQQQVPASFGVAGDGHTVPIYPRERSPLDE